jgi:hypothetical protein
MIEELYFLSFYAKKHALNIVERTGIEPMLDILKTSV